MKFDGFPEEKTILSFRLENGVGWLTTHHLIIQQEKHNLRLNIVERQDPEMYLLRDFDKAEIKGETLTARFKDSQKATIRLQFYSPALLQEVKDFIEKVAKYCK
ncbi:MAG: hypothetical protein ABR909_12955 [Candidatus Bathyarchaeia archaeon]|jgi:hypothetical protein